MFALRAGVRLIVKFEPVTWSEQSYSEVIDRPERRACSYRKSWIGVQIQEA